MNYDWTVTIDGVNVSALVIGGGTIDYGRPSRGTGFQAPVAQFDMFTQATFPNYAGSWPTIDLGDSVIIHVTWDGVTQWRRFTGVVQALDWNPGGLRVTASGTLTDWQDITVSGLETIGLSPYVIPVPAELETARVDRLCDDAGVSITIEGVPARKVRGIPAGELAQPLLDALLRIADDCDALLMEDRLGVVHYRTRNYDRPTSYILPSTVVERDSIDLAYERGTHINAVRVFYGEPESDTGQQDYVYVNDTGVYDTVSAGERLTELYTDIKYQQGAQGKGEVYLEKHRLAWEVPDVTLLMSQATGGEADDILDLQENFMVTVDDLPTGCPIASYDGDILGFTDIMSETDYRIVLHLGPRIADTGTPEQDDDPIYPDGVITGYETTGTVYDEADDATYRWVQWSTPGASIVTNTHTEAVYCQVMAVAGGGGGGAWLYPGGPAVRSGGGGAGGLIDTFLDIAVGATAITVGDGGAGGTAAGQYFGYNGGDTVIGSITIPGGGGGGGSANGYVAGSWTAGVGMDGGSGGGAAGGETPGDGTYGYGNDGGTGDGGGGGGALTAGGNRTAGTGVTSDITGTSIEYGRGGNNTFTAGSLPGQGGGGGYGGTSQTAGAPGADGTIILRYRIA